MNKYGYILKPNTQKTNLSTRYYAADLELMTILQLREICHKEKIVQGIIDPMDKEELIRVILRYRGADEYFLIQKRNETGWNSLGNALRQSKIQGKREMTLCCSSKITAYDGIGIGFNDNYVLPYDSRFVGTNAFIASGNGQLCAILNIVPLGKDRTQMYLTKSEEVFCQESEVKNYSLYCLSQRDSKLLYEIYHGQRSSLPEYMEAYQIPLMDFEVRKPVSLFMPIAIDFGTANTTVGVYLDNLYFEHVGFHDGEKGLKENDVNYARFYNTVEGWEETNLCPSVVGVRSVQNKNPQYVFGYEAIRLANSSYIDEGFCVFYDIKRWIQDYNKQEEITDREGHRAFVSRKDILKAYFEEILRVVQNQFKCKVTQIHISSPVKHKNQFQRLFQEILPGYAIEKDMLDEGVSVLYQTISDMIQRNKIIYGQEYQALIVDCGGGTTDLSSCRFRVWDNRVAYQIKIETAYENGDTDFGGNNLTYRIMQLLKIAVVNQSGKSRLKSVASILEQYDTDVFRYVDQYGADSLYRELEDIYKEAENILPTRFRGFENRSRGEYYKVKNNFYFLFQLAETVKKEFYNKIGTLRIALSSEELNESATTWIPADKWKLSIQGKEGLEVIKDFPTVYLNIYEIEILLKADIYEIICQFMERMYEQEALEEYSIIRLTGQSCKIDIFRDVLKEFVPGRVIHMKKNKGDLSHDFGLKLTCVDGALKYLRDKKYGFADVDISADEPALPYRITAFTHKGEEVVLIHRLRRNSKSGMISRNMENLTLELYLKDMSGKNRYQYTCQTSLKDFRQVTWEKIYETYGDHIVQADTDDIVGNEVRFFVWSKPEAWSFLVVPIYRRENMLFMGSEQEFFFEHEGWVQNFFDGTK